MKKLINKLKLSDRLDYLIIILYTFMLIFITLGFNNLYGSVQDWLSQHSTIPEYFRMLFYDTGKLIPNFAFHLGGGQNIYHYSYYGLLSPVFLVSYLFPFINMTTYTILSSIILYILTGILFYKFLRNSNFDRGLSLFLSLLIVTLPPINFHYHHHIMFVSYMPFLILALLGINKYIDNGKSILLILATFLVIMTNYYYSVCSLIVIFIYGIYKIIDKNRNNIIKNIFFLGVRLIISIMMAGILLLPTVYTVINSGRSVSSSIHFIELIKPNFKELLYGNYTMGLTAIFIIAIIGVIFVKKVKKSDLFLAISTILLTICPFVTYLLNGALYIRGKVLIPFILIYLVVLGKFIYYFFQKKVDFKILVICNAILSVVMFILKYKYIYYYVLDLLLCFIFLCLGFRFIKKYIIYIPTIVIIFFITIGINTRENYVSIDYYKEVNDSDTVSLINEVNKKDNDFYRTVNENIPKEVANKVYNNNYYTTTMYSSIYNGMYRDFYQEFNNIRYRNFLIQSGGNNRLFNNLMGVKYIVSKEDISDYELIGSKGDVKLYYNKDAYPIVYVAQNVGSSKYYNQLDFPYNMEYMLNYTVVNSNSTSNYNSSISEYKSNNINDSYEFEIDEDADYYVQLDESIKNKILFISFDMGYNQACSKGDQTISINGVVNKLTCKTWLYHNGNTTFQYVISSDDEIRNLSVNISAGKYKISNVKMYVMDNIVSKNYQNIDNLNIDNANSEISGDVYINNDTYIVTSIPYDEGFIAYVDGKKVECEIVNQAFLGFKIDKGGHQIKIKYISPWYNAGVVVSIVGFLAFIFVMILENKKYLLQK